MSRPGGTGTGHFSEVARDGSPRRERWERARERAYLHVEFVSSQGEMIGA